ncbi:uncharacterized protein LOC106152119 isoform X2 [Lingula anatina]|uniref:Uncharacterized protein LOC106152119 isoform X2 n=1 Tax=Lingula anatina TaxID=7574 RepID=A0A1S3H4Y4_LINAN|nr:uncharacterized protein LOC106152119 isoform X2 [Lingula anatina]|eukprot:XP_013381068.1 uncharacterized protein LOC106152119 isoform X2 [Lingula anatina]
MVASRQQLATWAWLLIIKNRQLKTSENIPNLHLIQICNTWDVASFRTSGIYTARDGKDFSLLQGAPCPAWLDCLLNGGGSYMWTILQIFR